MYFEQGSHFLIWGPKRPPKKLPCSAGLRFFRVDLPWSVAHWWGARGNHHGSILVLKLRTLKLPYQEAVRTLSTSIERSLASLGHRLRVPLPTRCLDAQVGRLDPSNVQFELSKGLNAQNGIACAEWNRFQDVMILFFCACAPMLESWCTGPRFARVFPFRSHIGSDIPWYNRVIETFTDLLQYWKFHYYWNFQ